MLHAARKRSGPISPQGTKALAANLEELETALRAAVSRSNGTGLGSPEQRGSVMRNPIDVDHAHSRAIRQEIGERLQQYLRAEPELPASIRRQVDRLGESWRASRPQTR